MNSVADGSSSVSESSDHGGDRRLSFEELAEAVRAAEPAAFLLPARILRRVIKHDRRLTGFGLRIPHRKCYVIRREALLEIADESELGLTAGEELPERVLLLARPSARTVLDVASAAILRNLWRLLFHASVHAALDERVERGELSAADVRRRIQQIGTAEFEEIRLVLGQEDMLLPPRGDVSIYVEFVAVYLELRYFAHRLLPRYFPGLAADAALDAMIGRDIDGERLFQAARLPGSVEPENESASSEAGERDLDVADEDDGDGFSLQSHYAAADTSDGLFGREGGPARTSEREYRRLMRKAQRPASLGNVVRAAIYRARAERCAPPEMVDRVRSAIKLDLSRLIRRLRAALEWDDDRSATWRGPLFVLVQQTPRGFWTPEAKLLYDLQKVCIDFEREVFTIDLVEWFLSWGKRPIKRQLPDQRDVLMLKHLRSADRRLGGVRLSDDDRAQLARLIQEAEERVQARLREQLRPQLATVLDNVRLTPKNRPERVARKKIIEELIDRVEDRGLVTMSSLRDAISRNQLKLPDVSRLLGVLHRDPLLRADRRLASALDGVYRRGEFYMRWMQRFSSLAFGTGVGRFVTRFVAVPFGGAYVVLAGLHHLWELVSGAHRAAAHRTTEAVVAEGLHLTSPVLVFALGAFLSLLVNSEAFRRAAGALLHHTFRFFQAAVVEPIRWVVQSPLVQQIFHSRLFSITFRFLIKPLLWTGLAWMFLPEESRTSSAEAAVLIFVIVNLLLNSRPGRIVEEVIADWIVQTWHQFGLRVIAGVFWSIIDLFRWWLATIERLMYSVDEWLRFKSGEGRVTLAVKAGLGVVWFFIAYVLRFCINVLIEPQINPIKHFPVVTVSHKLLLPLIPTFAGVLELTIDKPLAWTIAATTIWCIPGIFGFLVWELTGNWRLYAANRKSVLSPTPIGSHGETMGRLLRVGFHSGTLPKRFAKLRRAERRARLSGHWQPAHKHRHVLREVELAVRRFVEREFLELLAEGAFRPDLGVSLKSVKAGTNSVWLTFGVAEEKAKDFCVVLEVESGWLVAGVAQVGWAEQLDAAQQRILATAVLGLYKLAGVELVRQQIEGQFAQPMPWYDIVPAGLILWPESAEEVEVLYDLHDEAWIAPQSVRGLSPRAMPTIARRGLVFSEVPVAWKEWVAAWDEVATGRGLLPGSIMPADVLPNG